MDTNAHAAPAALVRALSDQALCAMIDALGWANIQGYVEEIAVDQATHDELQALLDAVADIADQA